jgi:hypothetical protein
MNSLTKENCIQLLTKLRDVYQGQLDTSVIVEIDEVIAALKMEDACCPNPNVALGERVLGTIATILRIVSNITELMQ